MLLKSEISFFFSDPPHLIKTVRNCFASNKQNLWVSEEAQLHFTHSYILILNPQCNGSNINWNHVVDLYNRDSGRGSGLAMVPKLKYEHLFNLTSFAKMRVDLAAQVNALFQCRHLLTI